MLDFHLICSLFSSALFEELGPLEHVRQSQLLRQHPRRNVFILNLLLSHNRISMHAAGCRRVRDQSVIVFNTRQDIKKEGIGILALVVIERCDDVIVVIFLE